MEATSSSALNQDNEDWIDSRGIPLEDLNESDIDDEDGDLIVEQHITLNNKTALERIADDLRIKDVALFDLPVVTTKEPVHVSDVFDDLKREEAFFQQALETVKYAVEKAKMENITMLPPSDEEGEMLRGAERKKSTPAPKRKKRKSDELDLSADAFDMQVDDDEEEESKPRSWKKFSPNAKLNRKVKSNAKGKIVQSALMKNKKKKQAKRPGKSKRAKLHR